MGWDKKRRGPGTGYFYLSYRTPDGVRKLYCGRGAGAEFAAAYLEHNRRERQAARDAVRAEDAATAEADRLAAEVEGWASLLAAAWMTAAGCHNRRGVWRRRRGRKPEA